MMDLCLSKLARSCLERDGWRPGRKCDPEQLALIRRNLLAGGGTPPSVAVENFIDEFGGLVLHRPTGRVIALSQWLVPCIRPGRFVHWANFRVLKDRWYKPVEDWMVDDLRKDTGRVYWVGSLTTEGWPLLVDNSFHFYAVDVCSDRVFAIADCLDSFIEEVYCVAHSDSISGPVIGVVQWSRDD